jgi:K319L-like, PKD domain
MTALRLLIIFFSIAAIALLDGCSQGNSGDQTQTSTAGVPVGIERFLLFPNPVVQPGGSFETNTTAYSQAYYAAIDPGAPTRDTLSKWKAANGFGTGGQEHVAVFLDVRDLGYGRRMTGRINADGSIAFFVENYLVSTSGGGYSSTINVDAAVVRDPKWHIGTNAIEWSCYPQSGPGCVKFAKFYSFQPDGTRSLTVNMDGRGAKAMPGPCITCHGGRGDPLDPGPLFPFVANTQPGQSGQRGDVLAHLHRFSVDTFQWSTTPGFTRADQEATLKTFNKWVLCSYPLFSGSPPADAGPEDACRPASTTANNEWEGTDAAKLIKQAYGGPGMASAQFSDTFVPSGWSSTPQSTMVYQQVIAPFCRTCHIVRGTSNQSDIDFSTEAKFLGYADRVKALVFDRGNMPLALLVYQDFWRSTAPQTLADYLNANGQGPATDSNGKVLQPGRPIANAGPALRMAKAGTSATLSGSDSLFANSFQWSQVSGPGSASIGNSTSAVATFLATVPGDYVVSLTVRNGSLSDTASITVTVPNPSTFTFPDPATIKFAQVLDVLRNNPYGGAASCIDAGCHNTASKAPIIYPAVDRDGVGGATETATDQAWLLQELSGRVNLTEITASPLLRKPIGFHHNAGTVIPASTINNAALASFSKVYYWILNGMPSGGVAASAGANSTPTVTFSGAPPQASVALDASGSIGNGLTYSWSVVSQPAGGNANIASPGSASTSMTFQNVGVYVVQVQVSNGTDTDTAQRTITVQETPVVASFTPSGNFAVTFSGSPTATGPITLTNTSTGNPTTCAWAILSGPSGASLSSTTSCTTTTLTVPSTAFGMDYQVQFTGSNVSTSNSVTNTIHILSTGSGVVANAGANSSNALTFANPSFNGDFFSSTAIPQATVGLNGSASSGPGTLTYSWSVIAQPGNATGSYAPSLSSSTAVSPTLTVRRKGVYTVQLVVDNGLPQGPSNTATRTITASVAAGNAFTANVIPALVPCTSCHVSGGSAVPSWKDEPVGGRSLYQRLVIDAPNPDFFVNTTDPAMSFILVCPGEGTCDATMGQRSGFHGGNTADYVTIMNWIIDGAPNN